MLGTFNLGSTPLGGAGISRVWRFLCSLLSKIEIEQLLDSVIESGDTLSILESTILTELSMESKILIVETLESNIEITKQLSSKIKGCNNG